MNRVALKAGKAVAILLLLTSSHVNAEADASAEASAEADAEADANLLLHPGGGAYAPYAAEPVAVPYCANGGECVPAVHCAPWYLESLYDPAASCYLAYGTPGVCCPHKKGSCK